jgi:hypothetical protein
VHDAAFDCVAVAVDEFSCDDDGLTAAITSTPITSASRSHTPAFASPVPTPTPPPLSSSWSVMSHSAQRGSTLASDTTRSNATPATTMPVRKPFLAHWRAITTRVIGTHNVNRSHYKCALLFDQVLVYVYDDDLNDVDRDNGRDVDGHRRDAMQLKLEACGICVTNSRSVLRVSGRDVVVPVTSTTNATCCGWHCRARRCASTRSVTTRSRCRSSSVRTRVLTAMMVT